MGRGTQWFLAVVCCVGAGLRAGTINVPGDYETIQEAIVAAEEGDEIVVGPGEYTGGIDFLGKPITVRSAEGPGKTAIMGVPPLGLNDAGSVVTFHGGETRDAVLEGFTISGGTGTIVERDEGGEPVRALLGGGVLIMEMSNPTVRGNVIRANTVLSDIEDLAAGGGIAVIEGSSPLIVENQVEQNTSQGGGGVCVGMASSPELRGNTIAGNRAEFGAGILVIQESTPVIEGNVIRRNEATWGGGLYVQSHMGPIVAEVMLVRIVANEISENEAKTAGGGLCLFLAQALVERCVIHRNIVDSGTWLEGWGGGLYCDGSIVTIASCFILKNSAQSGAGVYIQGPGSQVHVKNDTIYQNQAVWGGGVCMLPGPVAGTEVRNSILWENSGSFDGQSGNFYNGDPGMAHFSDFSDGLFEGQNGNFSLDPLFVAPGDDDLHLGEGSPCIDRGAELPGSIFDLDLDIDGDPRVVDGDGDGVAVIDVGADEVPPPPSRFIRGNVDGIGRIGLSDAILGLLYVFVTPRPAVDCAKAIDFDDNGHAQLADIVGILRFIFAKGLAPSAPHPGCGIDTTPDPLPCESSTAQCREEGM